MKNQVDPVVEEIHETRRQIARHFNFDVRQISADAKRRQMLEGRAIWQPRTLGDTAQPSGVTKAEDK